MMGMSPYVAELRGLVGNRLLLLPSVAVLPWDDDGRVLLVRQADSDLWATIGGAVEPDESPEAAAVVHQHARPEASSGSGVTSRRRNDQTEPLRHALVEPAPNDLALGVASTATAEDPGTSPTGIPESRTGPRP